MRRRLGLGLLVPLNLIVLGSVFAGEVTIEQTPGVIPVGITTPTDPPQWPLYHAGQAADYTVAVKLGLSPDHPKMGDHILLQSFYRKPGGPTDPNPVDNLPLRYPADWDLRGNYWWTKYRNLDIKKKPGYSVVVVATGAEANGPLHPIGRQFD